MRSQEVKKDISTLLRARCSLIWIQTPEEETAEAGIIEAAATARYNPSEVRIWDCGSGLQDLRGEVLTRDNGGIAGAEVLQPGDLFAAIENDTQRRIYIARDLHDWLDPVTKRQLRTLARRLSRTPADAARNLIVISPSNEIPAELKDSLVVLDWPLPDRAEVGAILDQALTRLPPELREGLELNGNRDKAVDAAIGLTAQGVARCFARSLVSTRTIDPALIQQEKRRVISAEKVLTWYEPEVRGLDAIGGLDALKRNLASLGAIMGRDAREFGVPAPKGLILAGAPGCGKSLAARCIPAAWGVSLLRLDFGALQSKYVGESQANVRKAFAVAETMAPCVLWIDEIDKALSGATGPSGDGGVAVDAVGTFLSWKQDCQSPVFVVATANNVIQLSRSFPELFRAGRWDGTYFVDLPHHAERIQILAASLKARTRNPEQFPYLPDIAAQTEGFSGAELAAVVDKALTTAYLNGKRPIALRDMQDAARAIIPLSRSAAETLKEVRDWAKGRAIPASDPPETTETNQTRGGLDLD